MYILQIALWPKNKKFIIASYECCIECQRIATLILRANRQWLYIEFKLILNYLVVYYNLRRKKVRLKLDLKMRYL